MSNRRKPTRKVPLVAGAAPTAADQLPWPLTHIRWTDEPAADYKPVTLRWIAQRASEAGRLNAWRCEVCDIPFIAYDLHPGTTPMMVGHKTFEPDTDCAGLCASVFYSRDGVFRAAIDLGQGGQQIQPSHEWYRPSRDELRTESRHVRDHVEQGGLLVREVAIRPDSPAPKSTVRLLKDVADPAAPTLAEVAGGVDLGELGLVDGIVVDR